MNIIIVGPPGAGKGTQAVRLSDWLKTAHIASGDFFRAEQRAGSPLGVEAKQYMEKGLLVPDELTSRMILERISRPDCVNGVILDGYPRTVTQARALDAALLAEGKGRKIDMVLRLTVKEDTVLHRMLDRVSCSNCGSVYNLVTMPPKVSGICDRCGHDLYVRKDDTAETIRHRIQTYRSETWPMIEYYEAQDLVRSFDGEQEVDGVFKDLQESIATYA